MRTDILGHPPSLCTYRRVWHPAIPTLPSRWCTSRGVHLSPLGFAACQSKKCTNQAATASSHRIHRTHRSLLLKCTPTEFTEFSCRGDFCVFCVFRGTILRNLNICVHLCHLWEDYLGLPHAPTQGVQLSQLHQPSCHCIFPQNSQNTQKPLAEMYSHRIHRIFLQRRTSVYSACSVGQYYAT